ncbi:Outer membrane protein assembly factor BamA [Chryseolinea serpens]|uniref:Outer membrane protein assembly factor BamA n=1 Tax=Chryseolinea serpens TaxID=947013 RepID=A0A1M5WZ81_9BACT|nr:BamA/TamA family outer membrane protein [Chryseolinea serpens]SHH92608.1 Outer membrane protein assembly factor BamA [Chryseolinea serpens]
MRRKNNITLLWSSLCWLGLCSTLLLPGCTGVRYLKEGETFYTGADIDFDTHGRRVGRRKTLRKDLDAYITPKPNNKLFGMRPGVWFYYVAGEPKKKNGLRGFIKNKLGQPPVLLKDAAPERTAKILAGQLNNEGYFESTVRPEVKTGKTASKVIYHVNLTRPYRLREINFPAGRDSTYAAIFRTLKDESLLAPKQRYDLQRLQAEQERIEKVLKDFGFYYFDDRYLIFEADSTVAERKVDLRLRLEQGIPAKARKIYSLSEVKVFPNYVLAEDSLENAATATHVNGVTYVEKGNMFRPEIITNVINLKKGDRYSREAQDLTLSHLMGLGVFKFVNIKFAETGTDSSLLRSNIFLTPLKKKSVRGEVQGVSKSNNFVGPGVTLTFTNRNFLRGAELFQLKLNSAYEVQISKQQQNPLNSFELGFEASLTIPRFITPIKINYNSRKYLPKTVIKTGFNLQNRVGYYRLSSANAAYGYNWRETVSRSHELFPIDLNYVRTDKRSATFDTLVAHNPVLKNSFENQFILGTRYSYTINTQLNETPTQKYEKRQYKTHNFYFNGNVDVAGNLLHTVQGAFHGGETGSLEIFGLPYSQYVKGDIDFRYYWQFDEHNKLATRLILGAGYAFGNSTTLPYVKQFAIGGSNSIRAFPARSVGPGTYNVRTDPKSEEVYKGTLFVDQRGDIKLESNVEYRFDIIRMLKGAVFVDAGNIWLWHEDPLRTGGKISSDFLQQLAVGTGFGLRFDFSFFVLRFDTAFPLRQTSGWVTNDIDFGSSSWRGKNLVFNIAIGYPF